MKSYDVIVIGAGMVGAAIAHGLAGRRERVLVLDGTDTDYRAAKANFGLVWVQGKGQGFSPYQRLSRRAASLWPAFARDLARETGIGLDYEQRGGLHFCLSDEEWTQREARLDAWHRQAPDLPECTRMLDRAALQALLPGVRLGTDVSGASLGERDGHVNPLKLLTALHKGMQQRGATLLGGAPVTHLEALGGGGFAVTTREERHEAARIVIAAGLGSRELGLAVGIDVPLRPQRGQLMVTERLAPMLPLPASGIRQTAEGTVMIGLTQEETGYDLSTTCAAGARMSNTALRILPDLAAARLVRHWSCLRIMTPDGCPVYAESSEHPGAFLALCHSGVTLASFHAGPLADSLADATLGDDLAPFHQRRFHVSTIA